MERMFKLDNVGANRCIAFTIVRHSANSNFGDAEMKTTDHDRALCSII